MSSSDVSKPHLIITVGIPGSGKSHLASHFANTFHAPIISDEDIRPMIFGIPSYTKEENEIVRKLLVKMLVELMKTERTIVYDGDTLSRNDRNEISKVAKDNSYSPLFVWVQTDQPTAKKRALSFSRGNVALQNDVFDNQVKRFTPPHTNEKPIVISGKHTYASQLKIILRHLASPSNSIEQKPNSSNRTPLKRTFLIR